MTVIYELVIFVLCAIIKISKQSITGVTYMDHFDFKERYHNVHECDPMYWHPLHLPDHCAKMYEKLIRSKVARNNPVRIMEEAEQQMMHLLQPTFVTQEEDDDDETEMVEVDYGDSEENTTGKGKNRKKSRSRQDTPIAIPVLEYQPEIPSSPWSPAYEKMFELIRQDVKNQPATPKITNLPNFGPVAVYHQPISKKSERVIKQIAGAYKLPKLPQQKSEYDIIVDNGRDKKKDKDKNKNKHKHEYNNNKEATTQEPNKDSKINRKKIIKGKYVAIIETKRIT